MPTEQFIFFECRETMHSRTLTVRIEKSVRQSGSFFRQSETMEGDKHMAIMKNRNLKVIAQSGYQYHAVPAIRLSGKWLGAAGFNIGDFISVKCEDGRLIIEPDAERAKMVEAEKAFMDRELKNLQKRFEAEKVKLHAQFVAESTAGYGVAEGV